MDGVSIFVSILLASENMTSYNAVLLLWGMNHCSRLPPQVLKLMNEYTRLVIELGRDSAEALRLLGGTSGQGYDHAKSPYVARACKTIIKAGCYYFAVNQLALKVCTTAPLFLRFHLF